MLHLCIKSKVYTVCNTKTSYHGFILFFKGGQHFMLILPQRIFDSGNFKHQTLHVLHSGEFLGISVPFLYHFLSLM